MNQITDLNHLSQVELAALWGCSTRTIQRLPELSRLRHGEGPGSYYVWSEFLTHQKALLSQCGIERVSQSDSLKKTEAEGAELGAALKQKPRKLAFDAEAGLAERGAAMLVRLLGISSTAALRIFPDHTLAERETIIRKEINEALEAVASGMLWPRG